SLDCGIVNLFHSDHKVSPISQNIKAEQQRPSTPNRHPGNPSFRHKRKKAVEKSTPSRLNRQY
ncbi:MAG: hypothetical protein K2G71_07495, partial [Duncaniella sp.]|nr:hypothetical protein [Duncaniella sp.]